MPLTLRSTSPETQWLFDPQGARTFAYLDVQDSWNINATEIDSATITGFVDSGNNTGWGASVSAVITVDKFGTQITTTTATSTDQDLGGAFTLTSDGAAEITSIKFKQKGSFATSSIQNIRFYSKLAVDDECSATKPVDADLFATATDFDADKVATSTGSLSLTADTPVCLYIVYDLGGPSGTSTMGRTIDFEITNPSTDIGITGGTVSTNSKVNINGVTMIGVDNVTIIANSPSLPETSNPACFSNAITSLLSVHVKEEAKNPTLYYLQNCAVWKQEGTGTPRRLTSSNLQVHTFDFQTNSNTGGTMLTTDITISNMDPADSGVFMNATKSLHGAVYVQEVGN